MLELISAVVVLLVTLAVAFFVRNAFFSTNENATESKSRRKAFVTLAQRKRISLVSSTKELSTAWDEFASEMRGIVGLDCEWTTTEEGSGPIALLQMALPTGSCLLIRTCCLEEPVWEAFPPSLCQMLADPKILKFGVGITFDADKLMTDHAVSIRGCVDLRHLVVRVRNNGLTRRGLKNIAKVWLGIEYESSKEVQCSVWDQEILSPVQVEYAAMDGVVAAYTVAEFLYRRHKLAHPASFEQLQADLEDLNASALRPFCQGVIDRRFKARQIDATGKLNSFRAKEKAFRIPERKRPLYTNAAMLAPDGQLLCMLDVRKAQWYLDKGLATLEEDGDGSKDSRMSIRLTFEPAARESGADWEFYTTEKVNQCAVCGSGPPFARKHIVPTEYRRCFPKAHKYHKSHDVLLCCLPCHRHSNLADEALRRQLAAEFTAPLGTRANFVFKKDERTVSAVRAAKALRLSGEKIPEARRGHLEKLVLDYFSGGERAPPPLAECVQLLKEESPVTTIRNENFVAHGEAVVTALLAEEGGIKKFERRWRQHFVDAMRPRFLPAGWSVNHRCSEPAPILPPGPVPE